MPIMRADSVELRAAALEVLSQQQPMSANKLLKVLRTKYGASHRAANETMFRLMHEGAIRRTFTGKLKLP